MKQLFYLPLVFLFCISITSFAQNLEWINYTKRIEQTNAIIPDFQVNDVTGSAVWGGWSDFPPSISTDGSGNFVITWTDKRNGDWDIYAQRYSSDGSTLGTNFKINDDQGGADQLLPSISTDGSGNFVITWTDKRNGDWDIYAQRYSSGGSILGTNFKINDDQGGADQWSPSISTDSSGNFAITWHDERNDYGDIYAQRYSSDGSPLGNNFKVNDDQGSEYQGFPSISTDDSGNFVITWLDNRNGYTGDIYAQRYSSDGSTLGTNFKVNDDLGSNWQRLPTISTDSSGNFVITWMDQRNAGSGDIYAQRYSSGGSTLGTNFKVTDDQGYGAVSPSISTESGGNFVITWEDYRNGDWDIYAQRYSSGGSTLGNNFMVTNISDSVQTSPDVKLWNGRIYNTWTDNRAAGTGYDIWANVLDWNNPVGISEEDIPQIPIEYKLSQNFPNPFNPTTTIKYQIPELSFVTLKVYDVLGSEVAILINEEKPIGTYEITWYAANLPSGIYFYRLQAGSFVETKKMILIK